MTTILLSKAFQAEFGQQLHDTCAKNALKLDIIDIPEGGAPPLSDADLREECAEAGYHRYPGGRCAAAIGRRPGAHRMLFPVARRALFQRAVAVCAAARADDPEHQVALFRPPGRGPGQIG